MRRRHQTQGGFSPLTRRTRPGWPAAAILVAALLAALLAVSQLSAATLLPMNLGDLCHRADRIFQGTILHIKTGTVTAGGGEIPTVHYTVEVGEPFKGSRQRRFDPLHHGGYVLVPDQASVVAVRSSPGLCQAGLADGLLFAVAVVIPESSLRRRLASANASGRPQEVVACLRASGGQYPAGPA